MQSTSCEMPPDGRLTSWNQDCWEKYQQPQIGTWYSDDKKGRETKKLLDEGERGE